MSDLMQLQFVSCTKIGSLASKRQTGTRANPGGWLDCVNKRDCYPQARRSSHRYLPLPPSLWSYSN